MSVTRFPSRFGKYILLDRINSGGMAEVYRAKVTGVEGFQRLVAIKCMLPQLVEDAQFTNMFIDEAKLAAQLTHPNIVQIHELGRIGERLYIAMELVSGHDLRHIVRTTQRLGMSLPPAFALYVIAKAAEALDFAHRKASMDGSPLNLVHRDVSPQNILISYDGDVKVVDFGIAKASARATETQAGTIKGKFSYMAPEQVTGDEVDRRADIFSLGAVLYEALSGQRLFSGESDMSILDKVARVDITPVKEFVAAGHPELMGLFNKTLARAPANRYGYASELAEDLEPLLIDKQRIFSAKSARAFMQMLYADDITFLAERMRDYANITDADISTPAVDDTPRHRRESGNEQVFETDFGSASQKSTTAEDFAPLAKTERNDLSPHETMQFAASDTDTELFEQIDIDIAVGTPVLARHTRDKGDALPKKSPRARRWPRGLILAAAIAATATLIIVLALQKTVPETKPNPPVTIIEPAPTTITPPAPQDPEDQTTTIDPPPTDDAPAIIAEPPTIINAPRVKEPRVVTRPTPRRPPPPPPPPPVDTGHGYISVLAIGLSGKVNINGEDVGFTPLLAQRVKLGKNVIKVIDVQPGGEERREEVVITAEDTRKSPKKIIVRF